MTKQEYIKLARKMFEGQFPNDIYMGKPDIYLMSTPLVEIKKEIWEWFLVSIDKFEEGVTNDQTR